jgi:hypothetical protein
MFSVVKNCPQAESPVPILPGYRVRPGGGDIITESWRIRVRVFTHPSGMIEIIIDLVPP